MADTLNKIIHHLQESAQMHADIGAQNLTVPIRKLQAWQTKRLLITHDDLWQSKRFKPAMQFFVDELYGPRDFSERDQELARVVPKMAKLLPETALVSLEAALRLNSLSLELDIALAKQLADNELNRDSYFHSYRDANNQLQRQEQIDLLESLGFDLAQVVKISGISAMLMLSRKPAKVAGVESLHQFLEKGFKSFKKLGKVEDFINPVVSREKRMMLELFSAKSVAENPLPQVNA